MSLQKKMDKAFDNYFTITEILKSDILFLIELDDDNNSGRRNYIRTLTPLIEGYSSCFREIASIGLECNSPVISNKERQVLKEESKFGAADRIKLTLKATYKMFELVPVPDFGGNNWENAKVAITKRGALMHPKSALDLEISESSWLVIRNGLFWLTKEHFEITRLLQEKNL